MKRKRGYALIVVLWSLVIIGIIFTNLVDETQLNNLLVEDNLRQKKLSAAAESGVRTGISLLVNDNTEYDTARDQWQQPQELKTPEGIKVKVKIIDLGSSKLNINYTSYQLLGRFEWWNDKLEDKLQKKPLQPRLAATRQILGDKYKKAQKVVTTYGQFNLNNSRLSSLRKLMAVKKISRAEQQRIIRQIKQKRRQSGMINSLEDLPGLVGSIEVDKLKPQLTAKGPLNINLVPEKILKMLLAEKAKEELSKSRRQKTVKRRAKKLLKYRQNKAIKDYQQLYRRRIIAKSMLEKLKSYFVTYSSYLLIEAKASQPGIDRQETVKVVVSRKREDNGWQIKILNWCQN